MGRLTKKDYDGMLFWYRNKGGWRMEEIDKLGRYEDVDPRPNYLRKMKKEYLKYKDIEEELGIDLITFFKYLSAKEVFFINDFNEVQKAVVRSIDKKGLIVFEEAFYWGECDFTLYFNDYGKTWALTKEELQQ